jgi:glycosyltransferase involved in cell wall biosynthesis
MNIGFDAKRAFFNRSGLGNYSRSLISNLSQLYPDNRYFLYSARSSGMFDLEDNMELARISFPAGFRRTFNMMRGWREHGIDLYHGLSNELPAKPSALVKTVVTMHDLLFQDFPEDYPFLDRKIYQSKVRHTLRVADHIVAISEVTKKDLVERFGVNPNRVSVIYQSCSSHFFIKKEEHIKSDVGTHYELKRPFFLCVSSFSFRKNQNRLVKAWLDSNLGKDFDLVLIGGRNKFRDELKAKVENGGARYRQTVKFRDVKSNDDLATICQLSYCMIYPSLKEGFGIPVLEGMASGRPVLTSVDTSCHEAGGNAVMTFDPNSISSIKGAMEQIAGNSMDVDRLIALGEKRLSALAPEIELPKLMAIYKRLTDK